MVDSTLSSPQLLIFDTGPLWELVIYSAVHQLRFQSLNSELQYLRTRPSYEIVTNFIGNFRNRTTTPHVVAEISSLIIRRTERTGHRAIWERVYTEFRRMGMDESVLKLLELPQKRVAEIGATDAGVLGLGLNFGKSKPVVLSVDFPLIAECKRAGVNAKHLREVLAGQ